MDCIEFPVLLGSTIKWTILAIFIGGVVGSVTGLFLKLLDTGQSWSHSFNYYYLFMPLAFFLSSYTIMKLAPSAEGHGTEKVIEAIHQRAGQIDIKVIPVKLFATLITLISGGSAGKEGPCAQIGAGIASFFTDLFKIKDEMSKKRFVTCGISAGFAGVFGTPIAGAIFAAEVLYVGRFSYIVLLPSLISSYVSYVVINWMGIHHTRYAISLGSLTQIQMLFHMIFFGIFIGFLAMLFIRVLTIIENYIHKIPIYKPLKGIIGGLILILVVFITGSKGCIGLGSDIIKNSIDGNIISKSSFLIKMFTTSITLGSGGSGGILTPVFYIGATFGNFWAQFFNLNIALFSAIGMVAFLSACANTPISSILIAIELFSPEVGCFSSIACAVSYLIVGHKSVYPSQLLAVNKSPAIINEPYCEIGQVDNVTLTKESKLLHHIYHEDKKENL